MINFFGDFLQSFFNLFGFMGQSSKETARTSPEMPQRSGNHLLQAPWEGTAKISQGNFGDYSHNTCGNRDIDNPNDPNCRLWENTYALDIALKEGTEVLAPADGWVKDIKLYCAGGKTLVLGHKDSEGNEFDTVYCHLSNILVNKEATVYQGDVIALSGSTVGQNSAGQSCKSVLPHLHFSVYRPSKHTGQYDSHTSPIENLYMREQGSNFRIYNSDSRDLNNKVVDKLFESANKKNGGTSQ